MYSVVHGYGVGARWNETTGLQESHWLDEDRQGPSDIVRSIT